MGTDRGKGSTTQPPPGLNLQKFAESRAPELETLHSIVADRLSNNFRSRRNKRRRTTAYNNRASSKKQRKLGVVDAVDSFKSKKEKKVPRHIRRRAELRENPEAGFCASGDGTKRLRTHVWHAKRFTMTKLWGFHLPLGLQGGGRGSRALLKWFNQGVLVHDASYNVAFQLEGPEDSLVSILQTVLVSHGAVHSEDANVVLSGLTYGSAMLHHVGAPVSQPIAPVTYMWRPCGEQNIVNKARDQNMDDCKDTKMIEACSPHRQLWVWMHASVIEEGHNALKFACQKEMDENGTSISCFSLEGQIAKLEVIGFRAYQHLQKILHPVTTSMSKGSLQFFESSVKNADGDSQVGESSIYENGKHISSHAILSFTVKDPRACLAKTVGEVPESDPTSILTDVPENEATKHATGVTEKKIESLPEYDGALYDRKDLWDTHSKINPPVEEHVLCTEKHHSRRNFFCLDSNSGVLNSSANLQCSRSCPILLLKNDDRKGSGVGWSIILPLSWVRAFWVPLVSRGAHAIGLRERHWVAYEVGLPYFPWDFPDCKAYSCSMENEAVISDQRAELRPPAVRPFRVPILPPWNTVCHARSKELTEARNTDFFVEKVTDKHMVSDKSQPKSDCGTQDIKSMLDCGDHGIRSLSNQSNSLEVEVNAARTSFMLTSYLNTINGDHLLLFPRVPDQIISFSELMKDAVNLSQSQRTVTQLRYDHRLCFLRVILHPQRKGVFEEGAVVCAPQLNDISSRLESNSSELQMPESSVRSYFKEQSSGMWELQVPDDPVTREAHRWPVGFVTTGSVRGSKKAGAQAFCEATLLARLREDQWNQFTVNQRRKEIYVLVRNLRSSAYRLALATIVMEEQEEDLEFM